MIKTTKNTQKPLIYKPFYFIRHGQTDWNVQKRIMGHLDIPLNETGIKQAEQLQSLIQTLPITHVYHSPLQRAEQTMRILTQKISCPIFPQDALKEWHLGDLQGTARNTAADENFIDFEPPNGESAQQLVQRVHEGLHQILSESQRPLLVAHSGIYAALCHILNIEKESIDHCQLIHFEPDEKGGKWKCSVIEHQGNT